MPFNGMRRSMAFVESDRCWQATSEFNALSSFPTGGICPYSFTMLASAAVASFFASQFLIAWAHVVAIVTQAG